LHGNNSVIGVLDENQGKVFVQKAPNDLKDKGGGSKPVW
jgi:hypothetical protein